MGLLFKFGQAVPESRDIPIFVYTWKNWDFLEFYSGSWYRGIWTLEWHQKTTFFLFYNEITVEKLTYL